MARIYADSTGKLLRVLREHEESMYPDPPDGTASTLDLDDATNAAILDAIASDWGGHTLDRTGKLARKGRAVAIAADGQKRADRKTAGNLAQRLAANSPDLTPAEIKRLFRILIQEAKG